MPAQLQTNIKVTKAGRNTLAQVPPFWQDGVQTGETNTVLYAISRIANTNRSNIIQGSRDVITWRRRPSIARAQRYTVKKGSHFSANISIALEQAMVHPSESAFEKFVHGFCEAEENTKPDRNYAHCSDTNLMSMETIDFALTTVYTWGLVIIGPSCRIVRFSRSFAQAPNAHLLHYDSRTRRNEHSLFDIYHASLVYMNMLIVLW